MAITEENTNPFSWESLADQLQNSWAPQPNPELIEQSQQIEGLGDTIPTPQKQNSPVEKSQEKILENTEKSTVDLLDDTNDSLATLNKDPQYEIKRYNKWFIIAVVGIAFFGALSFMSYLFYQYLDLKSQPEFPQNKMSIQDRVQKTSDTYDEYGTMLGLFDKEQYSNLSLSREWEAGAKKVLNDGKLNFVQKKDLLQKSLTTLGEEIITTKTDINELTENLNKDGFFPQDLVDILKENNAVGSIQRSLLSLEVVKFSSAMKVFSLMDVFVSSLADTLGYTKSDIREKLNELIERGERDVEYYLNVCYNNPYEPVKCDKIDDFGEYYKKIREESDFDTSFFKTLMEFIDNKLEYSNVPSFAITFNSFDGKSNSIGFTVEVNTLKEDEYALVQQGVKSPHIFIVSELIKLLKQSTFIVGKAIDAKDIKVSPKQITIGGSKYTVNNSVKNFNLPIQKTTDREIFDFVEKYVPKVQNNMENKEINASLSSRETSYLEPLQGSWTSQSESPWFSWSTAGFVTNPIIE